MTKRVRKYKFCLECKMMVPRDGFNKNNRVRDGLQTYCRECSKRRSREYYKKNKERLLQRKKEYNGTEQARKVRREYRKKNHGKILRQVKGYYKTERGRDLILKRKYGVALKQHQQMYVSQNGCCALCGKSVAYDKVHTDHDHVTDKVRGLLCRGCNIGLGHLGDTYEDIMQAARYLRGDK